MIELGDPIRALHFSSTSLIKVELENEVEIGFIPAATVFGVSQFLLSVLDRASRILEGDEYEEVMEHTSGAKYQKGNF